MALRDRAADSDFRGQFSVTMMVTRRPKPIPLSTWIEQNILDRWNRIPDDVRERHQTRTGRARVVAEGIGCALHRRRTLFCLGGAYQR
jgi:hypothetical protein